MPIGMLSPDALWVWDGARWLPAVSADGAWRWDGARWMPALWFTPGHGRPPQRVRPRVVLGAVVLAAAVTLIVVVAAGRTTTPTSRVSVAPQRFPAPAFGTSTLAPTPYYPGMPVGTMVFPAPPQQHAPGPVDYAVRPPAGGMHAPQWLNCGIYDAPVHDENAVHSQEHGVVWVTYSPSLSAVQVATLRALVRSEYAGAARGVILSPYAGQTEPVVASAWGVQLRLQSVDDARLRAFVEYFRFGPQTPEPGGLCIGGVGTPIDGLDRTL